MLFLMDNGVRESDLFSKMWVIKLYLCNIWVELTCRRGFLKYIYEILIHNVS